MANVLIPCKNGNCDRITKAADNLEYCCYHCLLADEGDYLIKDFGLLGHSGECNERHKRLKPNNG
jgi:hypothetical protein